MPMQSPMTGPSLCRLPFSIGRGIGYKTNWILCFIFMVQPDQCPLCSLLWHRPEINIIKQRDNITLYLSTKCITLWNNCLIGYYLVPGQFTSFQIIQKYDDHDGPILLKIVIFELYLYFLAHLSSWALELDQSWFYDH